MVTVTITPSLLVLHLISRNLHIFSFSLIHTVDILNNKGHIFSSNFTVPFLAYLFQPILTQGHPMHFKIQVNISIKCTENFYEDSSTLFPVGKSQLLHNYFDDCRCVDPLCFLVIKGQSHRPLYFKIYEVHTIIPVILFPNSAITSLCVTVWTVSSEVCSLHYYKN